MKIAIIGYSGAGKSTLAAKLGAFHGADVLHLDTVQFLPNWVIRDEEEKRQIVGRFLDSHSAWVIDGNYSALHYERRLEEADLIIMLLFGRFNCLWRVTKRYFKYRGTTRPDIGEGCDEKLDREFIWWILHDGRIAKRRARYKALYNTHKEKAVVIKNQRQLNKWMQTNLVP